jgi:phosphohistidine phosphatase
MRRLILFRHGKAETAGPSGGDGERRLTTRGCADSAATAQWLSETGFIPDLVLVSSAARTRETWDASRAFFAEARAEPRDRLYLATPETIRDVVEAASTEADTVMVIGHNPGLQDLGLELVADGGAPRPQAHHMRDGFPTAAAWVFRMRQDGEAALEAAYEPPKRAGDGPRWQYLDHLPGGRA